jgi:hypothetical protein
MKRKTSGYVYTMYPKDSPTEIARKSGLCGDGNWPGFDSVYNRISSACDRMAQSKSTYLSELHVETMGDLGSGHEERMKYRLHWLITYGWIK